MLKIKFICTYRKCDIVDKVNIVANRDLFDAVAFLFYFSNQYFFPITLTIEFFFLICRFFYRFNKQIFDKFLILIDSIIFLNLDEFFEKVTLINYYYYYYYCGSSNAKQKEISKLVNERNRFRIFLSSVIKSHSDIIIN